MGSTAIHSTFWGRSIDIDRFLKFVRRRLGGGAAASAPLISCDFDLWLWGFGDEALIAIHKALVKRWIRHVVRSHVEVLGVSLWLDDGNELELTHSNLPVSEKYLKEVELTNIYGLTGNCANVVDFTGCPALQKLKMESCQIFADKMRSPSLEHLSMIDCQFRKDDRTLIVVPNFILLKMADFRGSTPLLESLSSLASAVIRLSPWDCTDCCGRHDDCFDDFDVCGQSDCDCGGCLHYYRSHAELVCTFGVILHGLTEATHLELSAPPDVFSFLPDAFYS